MMIIDPTVTPVSPVEDIRAWLSELADMPQDETAVIDETERARDCLARSLARSAPPRLTPAN